jgi:hypothetical protein
MLANSSKTPASMRFSPSAKNDARKTRIWNEKNSCGADTSVRLRASPINDQEFRSFFARENRGHSPDIQSLNRRLAIANNEAHSLWSNTLPNP